MRAWPRISVAAEPTSASERQSKPRLRSAHEFYNECCGAQEFPDLCSYVVEVEVSDDGTIKIPRVDAGLVVNPEVTRAQFEVATVFGTSVARSGEITAKNGAIEQSNFVDYPVALNEAPHQTNVYSLIPMLHPREWASPVLRPSFRHCVTRFSRPPENAYANCHLAE